MPAGSESDWVVPDDLQPGTYTFYCEIPGHRQAGMEGTITIVAPEAAGGTEEEASPAADGATPAAGSATPTAGDEGSGGGETAISLGLIDVAFSETELTIPANTDVTLTLTNQGAAVHDFTIDDPAVSSGPVEAGQTTEVVLNLPPGTYEYYCSQPAHKQAGMVGTLTVE